MDDEWGPWIEHDGAMPVRPPVGCRTIQLVFEGDGIEPPDFTPFNDTFLILPGFYWRWRRVRRGWFTWKMRRVCDEPYFAPIIRYRFQKPPVFSAAVEELRRIADNPNAPIPERRPNREFAQ